METLIELKAAAWDASVQVRAWQEKLNALTIQINNYVEPPKEVKKSK